MEAQLEKNLFGTRDFFGFSFQYDLRWASSGPHSERHGHGWGRGQQLERGWDVGTGLQKKATLERFGLAGVARDLRKVDALAK